MSIGIANGRHHGPGRENGQQTQYGKDSRQDDANTDPEFNTTMLLRE